MKYLMTAIVVLLFANLTYAEDVKPSDPKTSPVSVVTCHMPFQYTDANGKPVTENWDVTIDLKANAATVVTDGQTINETPVYYYAKNPYPAELIKTFLPAYGHLTDDQMAPFISGQDNVSFYGFNIDGEVVSGIFVASDPSTKKVVSKLFFVAANRSGLCQ